MESIPRIKEWLSGGDGEDGLAKGEIGLEVEPELEGWAELECGGGMAVEVGLWCCPDAKLYNRVHYKGRC